MQLPHEAGPEGGELPAGEGCYQCDHDFGEIPLTKRNKRSLDGLKEADTVIDQNRDISDLKNDAEDLVDETDDEEEEDLDILIEMFENSKAKDDEAKSRNKRDARRSKLKKVSLNVQLIRVS